MIDSEFDDSLAQNVKRISPGSVDKALIAYTGILKYVGTALNKNFKLYGIFQFIEIVL
jgi:hypothetical protein